MTLDLAGLIEQVEGERLAEAAASVPPELAIVELGSYRGLSSCYLGQGAKSGKGAHVYCVDPWPAYDPASPVDEPDDSEVWNDVGAFELFAQNVAAQGLGEQITPLRGTATEVAKGWDKPVGMLFHDADHAYEAVKDDYLAWLPHLVPGAWVAVHDYYGSNWENGGWVRTDIIQTAIPDHVLTTGTFIDIEIVDNLWVGCRI